jgi:sugar fermentation stimulation protein
VAIVDDHQVPLLEGTFLRRPNRFVVYAQSAGREYRLHMPNPGSLGELLLPGRKILFETKDTPSTQGLVRAVFYQDQWVPLVAVKANDLGLKILRDQGYEGEILREFTHRHSRFDLHLPAENRSIEIKACTLVEHGRAMFPDAPSDRALRHLEELVNLSREGVIAGGELWVMILHSQARCFTPSYHTDPAFSLALQQETDSASLGLRAFSFSFDRSLIPRFLGEVPVDCAPVQALHLGGICLGVEKSGHELRVKLMSSWTGKAKDVHRRHLFPELKKPLKTFPIYTAKPDALRWWEQWANDRQKATPILADPDFWEALLLWRHTS